VRRLFVLAPILAAALTAAGCSKDPDAFTTDLTSNAAPAADNGCQLPGWSTTPEAAVPIQLVTGRHDGTELVIEGATGTYLTTVADDDKLLGDYTGEALDVTRLGTTKIAVGDCAFRVVATFVGTTDANTLFTGTLTYTAYQPNDACATSGPPADCTSTVAFTQ
jgi:hypothetical protein